jgi:hypothetical protein
MNDQALQPYEQPAPEPIDFDTGSGQAQSENIITQVLEMILGGSFVGTTFIMEVIVPGKENEGDGEAGPGGDEEPEPEDEE